MRYVYRECVREYIKRHVFISEISVRERGREREKIDRLMFLRKRGKNVVIGYVQLGILKLCDAEERESERASPILFHLAKGLHDKNIRLRVRFKKAILQLFVRFKCNFDVKI